MTAPTILLADDDGSIRTVVSQALGRAGYEVKAAGNAATLWRWVSDGEGDLVITDVQMPHLDGFGLLSAIREDPVLVRMPVILVTSLERREDRARGLALGADAYIVKRQFSQDELLSTIRQLL